MEASRNYPQKKLHFAAVLSATLPVNDSLRAARAGDFRDESFCLDLNKPGETDANAPPDLFRSDETAIHIAEGNPPKFWLWSYPSAR
jgi:hypothetical protein